MSVRQIRKLQQEKKTLQQEQEECGEQSLHGQQQQLQIRKDQIHEMDAAKQQTQQLRRGLKQPTCRHIQQVEQRDHVIAARCFVTERDVQLQELSQRLAASEQVVAELQQNLQWKEGKIQELQKRDSTFTTEITREHCDATANDRAKKKTVPELDSM